MTGRTRAVAVSTVAVLVPAGGGTASVWQAASLATSGQAAAHWADTLLLLACLGCAGTLLWATAAAAVGVREGWHAGSGAGQEVGTGPRPPLRGARRPGHVMAATVAAVVVAALTAGPAAASTQPTTAQWVTTAPAPPSTTPPAPLTPATAAGPVVGAEADDGPEGTWLALADPPPPRAPTPREPVASVTSTTTDTRTAGTVALAAVEPFRPPRAVDPATTALVTGTPTRSTLEREVVVHTGDSLWSLVEAHLGARATDAEVARTWPSWWQANRTTIGDNPHRLLPGQRLVVPVP